MPSPPATPLLLWATDASYTNGPFPGQPNKETIPLAFAAEGFVPSTQLPSEFQNEVLSNYSQWIQYLDSLRGYAHVGGTGTGTGTQDIATLTMTRQKGGYSIGTNANPDDILRVPNVGWYKATANLKWTSTDATNPVELRARLETIGGITYRATGRHWRFSTDVGIDQTISVGTVVGEITDIATQGFNINAGMLTPLSAVHDITTINMFIQEVPAPD